MLKDRQTLFECDPRYSDAFVCDEVTGAMRNMVLADMWSLIEPLELPGTAPEHIRDQFDKARHAFVYSWFSYDLATLAEQQGYAVVEMALRERYEAESSEASGRPMLAKLLQIAQDRGWLDRADFAMPSISGEPKVSCILDLLPMLRNELAHGSNRLMPVGSLELIRLCFDVLVKLYDKPCPGADDDPITTSTGL